MSTSTLDELQDFQRFVGEKISTGGPSLSPEEILDEWRLLHPDPQADADDRTAIQEALRARDNGDQGISIDEFDREFRIRHKLPAES